MCIYTNTWNFPAIAGRAQTRFAVIGWFEARSRVDWLSCFRTLRLLLIIHFPFSFKENEQFRIQEEKRKAREKKREEEAAKHAKAGGVKGKKNKPRPLDEEQEGCIVDRLLNDIRKGFPLRKSSRTSTSGGVKSASPRTKLSRDEGGNAKRAKDGFRRISSPAKIHTKKLDSMAEEENEKMLKRNLDGPSLPIK